VSGDLAPASGQEAEDDRPDHPKAEDEPEGMEQGTIGSRQLAKRQETWFRHQLAGNVLMLDATRPPEKLAREIAALWERYDKQRPLAHSAEPL